MDHIKQHIPVGLSDGHSVYSVCDINWTFTYNYAEIHAATAARLRSMHKILTQLNSFYIFLWFVTIFASVQMNIFTYPPIFVIS
jgi:hypothetical protein